MSRHIKRTMSMVNLRQIASGIQNCLFFGHRPGDHLLPNSVQTLTEVWRGNQDLRQAIRRGAVGLEGPAALKRLFPKWLQLSVFAKRRRSLSACDHLGLKRQGEPAIGCVSRSVQK